MSPWSTGWRCHDRRTCRFVLATWCSMFHQCIWIKHKQSVGIKKHLDPRCSHLLNFWKDAEKYYIQNIIRQHRAMKGANETDKTESFHRYSALPMDVLDKPPPQRLHLSGTGYLVMFMMKGQALVHLIHFSGDVLFETRSMMKYEFSSYVPAHASMQQAFVIVISVYVVLFQLLVLE